ncbi:MAG: glycerophosphodiester phosphodiesterase, partial [Victivallales bacterium]|nr:glycerophosphodiester phosphodiesterase [Victivallales bacterium]
MGANMELGISRRMVFGVIVASFLCVMGTVAQCAEPLPTTRPNFEVMKIAHRGVVKYAPENTIPAIEKAIKIGMDYVELDIRYTKD